MEEACPYGEEKQSDVCADTVSYLVEAIKYKGEAAGIRVVVCEEAIQSKASSIDEDQIPVYGNDVAHTSTGKRVNRGLYRSKNGILMNTDINGVSNIIRKVYPCMLKRERWSRGTMNIPVMRIWTRTKSLDERASIHQKPLALQPAVVHSVIVNVFERDSSEINDYFVKQIKI